jgi:GNAT superfamily N-acetyltransferase
MNADLRLGNIKIEVVEKGHAALPVFFGSLPRDSGWPPQTVLSLTDREPTEFEHADHYVAAFSGDKIVGLISVHPSAPGNYHRQHNLHLHIDVLPGWRKQGIGSALIRELILYARERGFWRIHLGTLSWNRSALALFSRFGFRVEGISRAAYRVKTQAGDDYFIDGIGMALWIGPSLHLRSGDWKQRPQPPDHDVLDEIAYCSEDAVETDELVALYAAVGDHRHRFPDLLKRAWSHSHPSVTARRSGHLVGLARAVTDRHTTLFVCDVMVEPKHQRQGIGSHLMRRLIAPYQGIYQIVLLTDPETLPFYRTLGFLQWESACLKMDPPSS